MLKNEGKKCSVKGCAKPAKTRLLCSGHYQAAHARGEFQKFTAEDRYWAKVNKSGGLPDFTDPLVRVTEADGECWLWTGAMQGNDYGSFWLLGHLRNAHRVSLTWADGSALDRPEQADHLCRRSSCVRPTHLEWVSRSENVRRGVVSARRRRRALDISAPEGFEVAETSEAKTEVTDILSDMLSWWDHDTGEEECSNPEWDTISTADKIVERLIRMGWRPTE